MMQSRDDTAIERIALRPAEAARAIGVDRRTIYRMMDRGDLPSKVVGGTRLIAVEDLKAMVSR
jgi:excisionase family DNA binding protein